MEQLRCTLCASTNFLEENGLYVCGSCETKYYMDGNHNLQSLICNLCGSRDIVEQSGVFICLTCGSKIYEVRRKESVEEITDLYKAAREARNAGNYPVAELLYKKIKEDIFDKKTQKDKDYAWEAEFYSAYCAVLNSCDEKEMRSASETMYRSIPQVFYLIYWNAPMKLWKEAYTEIAIRSLEVGSFLIKTSNNLNRDLISSMHLVAKMIMEKFYDTITAHVIINQAIEVCKINKVDEKYYSNLQKFSTFLNTGLAESQKEESQRIAQQRHEEFWEKYQSEKKEIEFEKIRLEKEIENIERKTEKELSMLRKTQDISLNQKSEEFEKQIKVLTAHRDSLGFFKKKEKQAIQKQINQAIYEQQLVQEQYVHSKKEIENRIKHMNDEKIANINKLNLQLEQINEVLNKNRFLYGGYYKTMWDQEIADVVNRIREN